MESALYCGRVRHRRFEPKEHEFSYPLFMFWLDLDELDEVFSKTRLWSLKKWSFVRFKREDFFDGSSEPLKQTVQHWVKEQTGTVLNGPVRMLANLRIAGYLINPIVCYYLYAEDGKTLQYVVAEVTNTPWKQRQHYLLPCQSEPCSNHRTEMIQGEFSKEMHVSTFHPMNMCYRWRLQRPSANLNLHLDNLNEGEKVFDATLMLTREALCKASMRSILWRYPMMTFKVAWAIYWQVFKLWRKGVPVYMNADANSDSRVKKKTAAL